MRRFGQSLRGTWKGTLASLAFAAATGCAGTETGNPPAAMDGTRDVVVLPGEVWAGPPYFDGEVLADAARLGSAFMRFARVELLPEGTCAPLLENPGASVSGAVVVDLAEGFGFLLPPGRYCGLRLFPELASADDPTVPPLLVGHSLLFELSDLEGTSYVRVRSQRVAPFVLLSGGTDPSVSFEVPSEGSEARLAVDAASALIDLRFWEATLPVDGSYVFEETNAAPFLRAFESYPGLLRLYRTGIESTQSDAGVIPGAPAFSPEDELVRTP